MLKRALACKQHRSSPFCVAFVQEIFGSCGALNKELKAKDTALKLAAIGEWQPICFLNDHGVEHHLLTSSSSSQELVKNQNHAQCSRPVNAQQKVEISQERLDIQLYDFTRHCITPSYFKARACEELLYEWTEVINGDWRAHDHLPLVTSKLFAGVILSRHSSPVLIIGTTVSNILITSSFRADKISVNMGPNTTHFMPTDDTKVFLNQDAIRAAEIMLTKTTSILPATIWNLADDDVQQKKLSEEKITSKLFQLIAIQVLKQDANASLSRKSLKQIAMTASDSEAGKIMRSIETLFDSDEESIPVIGNGRFEQQMAHLVAVMSSASHQLRMGLLVRGMPFVRDSD
ncbi:hypothetical protein BCR43DRAFT_563586 [Syncephalastrum racemosum]|uniref:Uncharacterized protein n=1 Tax=Syncephalastrum racemosum TaxID=13706 RepID=A0A1X2HBN2_SYNRA|nr:hypothetical protein BCR43DRAFT_563586 [Syncephalastrum racemosum]